VNDEGIESGAFLGGKYGGGGGGIQGICSQAIDRFGGQGDQATVPEMVGGGGDIGTDGCWQYSLILGLWVMMGLL